jgi:hypothetical protein
MRPAFDRRRAKFSMRNPPGLLLNAQREQLISEIETMKAVKSLKNGSRKKSTEIAPKPAKLETAGASARSAAKPVVIEARIDVGFGNALYLRGEGKGLSWDHGVPLTCLDKTTWKWSEEVTDPVRFKLLLNDTVWSAGEDLVAAPGQKVEISPSFS